MIDEPKEPTGYGDEANEELEASKETLADLDVADEAADDAKGGGGPGESEIRTKCQAAT